jgi:hypothetical protein
MGASVRRHNAELRLGMAPAPAISRDPVETNSAAAWSARGGKSPMTRPTLPSAIVEALRNAGATEEIISPVRAMMAGDHRKHEKG